MTDNEAKDNYAEIVRQNLEKLFSDLPSNLAGKIVAERISAEESSAEKKGEQFLISAFGGKCSISKDGVKLIDAPLSRDGFSSPPSAERERQESIIGILVTLYALGASEESCITAPFRGFKEFPGTMPYVGAFTTHTEHLLIPHVDNIKKNISRIREVLRGEDAPAGTSGDFSFVIYPLPKIALSYIFYEKDDDFDASVTCLFSNNADRFISTAGLADIGEYTSRTILEIIKK